MRTAVKAVLLALILPASWPASASAADFRLAQARPGGGAPVVPAAPGRMVPPNPAPPPPIPQMLPRPMEPPPPSSADAPQVASEPGEVLVLTVTPAGAQDASAAAAALGLAPTRRWPLASLGAELAAYSPPPGADASAAAAGLAAAVPAAVVDVNARYRLEADPRLFAQAAIGWRPGGCTAGRSVPLGLIDTGLARSHPALARADLVVRSFLASGEQPARLDHGTAIAALLVGAPESGPYAGLLPGTRLFAASVFGATPQGETSATTEAVARALDWLAGGGVRVANLSFSGPRNAVLSALVAMVAERGMLLVAAAGNGGAAAAPAHPAADAAVVAVTALDAALRPYAQANRGDYIDFAAPGVDLWVAQADGRGAYRSGTSFAVPFVVAIAAAHLGAEPGLASRHVVERLRRNAVDLGDADRDPRFGWGLAQADGGCVARP